MLNAMQLQQQLTEAAAITAHLLYIGRLIPLVAVFNGKE
jgi:hypothetical protein